MTQGYRREPNWYMNDGTYNRLSRAAIVTLAHMTKLMHGGKWCGSVSTNRLVELTGLGRSSVCRALTELRDAGILERETGQHAYEINTDPRPTGGTDCSTGGTPDVPRVAHARPTGGTPAPHGWDSHPYSSRTSFKNTLQEGACVRDGLIPHNGTRVDPYEVSGKILDAAGWPNGIDRRSNAKNLIAHALLALADGAEDDEAAANPIDWLGRRLAETVKAASEPSRVPDMPNWFNTRYPHLTINAQPFGYGRRNYP
jgi:hypothetical protein